MARMIDADALKEVFEKMPAMGFKNIDGQTYTLVLLAQVFGIIDQQPTVEERKGKWIPCSEPPEESGTYIVTAYDGIDKRVTFVKYQKTLKRWDLTGARAYWRILAYKPLPEPWGGEE